MYSFNILMILYALEISTIKIVRTDNERKLKPLYCILNYFNTK